MRKLIGPDLVRKLTARNGTIFDKRLAGFFIRQRDTGTHSYRYIVGRGQIKTLGRVGDIEPEAARAAAEGLRAQVSSAALAAVAADPKLTTYGAKARVRAELRQQRGSTRRQTWAGFLAEYEKLATPDMKSAGETLRRLRLIAAWFGPTDKTRIDSLTTFEVERWRASRRKDGASPSTINRDLDVLRAALNWAIHMKLLAGDNPAHGLKRVRADQTATVRYLSDAEEKRLRAALTARDTRRRADRDRANRWRTARGYDLLPTLATYTDHLTPFVVLAINTGARRGELFNLCWRDVDLPQRTMTVQGGGTKNRQTRVIPLNAEAVKVLKTWAGPTRPAGDAYVFPGDENGRLVDIKTAWSSLTKAAKLPAFRLHDCRHHFASRLVQQGVDLAIVRELMGHSNIKITLRYASLAPRHRADAVALLVRS